MGKTKENILFALIFLVVLIAVNKGLDPFLGKEESWIEIIIRSSIVTLILLIAKIFGFLDKNTKSIE